MKLHASILAGIVFLAGACKAAATPTIESFLGSWKVVRVVGYADMSGGDPLGKQMLGQVLRIGPNEISLSLDGGKCKPTTGYRIREVDTAAYLEKEAGAAPQDAKLPSKAIMLDNDNCTTPFWIDEDHIEFDFLGVFVIAERVPPAGR